MSERALNDSRRKVHLRWPNVNQALCATHKPNVLIVLTEFVSECTCLMCKYAVAMGWHVIRTSDDRIELKRKKEEPPSIWIKRKPK